MFILFLFFLLYHVTKFICYIIICRFLICVFHIIFTLLFFILLRYFVIGCFSLSDWLLSPAFLFAICTYTPLFLLSSCSFFQSDCFKIMQSERSSKHLQQVKLPPVKMHSKVSLIYLRINKEKITIIFYW